MTAGVEGQLNVIFGQYLPEKVSLLNGCLLDTTHSHVTGFRFFFAEGEPDIGTFRRAMLYGEFVPAFQPEGAGEGIEPAEMWVRCMQRIQRSQPGQ